jgi:hypothetical protein
MSVIGSNILAGASGQGGGGYNLTNSLRFRQNAEAFLSRTPASASNRKTWTLSSWIKRGSLSNLQMIFCVRPDFSAEAQFQFNSNDTITFIDSVGGVDLDTSAVYRDPSAWYHIVLALDTTQATDTNRVKIYVNGVQQTLSGVYPTLNSDLTINTAVQHRISSLQVLSNFFFDGYLTETNFVDGQALTPSSFGENNEDTGVWQPKEYVGTYGTNGFYLPFSDNSSATPTGLGKDFSGNTGTTVTGTTTSGSNSMTVVSLTGIAVGNTVSGLGIPSGTYVTAASVLTVTLSQNATSSNVSQSYTFSGNNWTTNNISITAGATYDSMTDVPTLTSATASNFAVLNPLNSFASTDCSNANLQYSNATSGNRNTLGTIYVSSGKYYAEFTAVAGAGGFFVGIANTNFNAIGNTGYIGSDINSYGYYFDGNKYTNSTPATYGAGWSGGDIIGVALDMDAGTVTFYKNGTTQGVAFTGLSGSFTFGAMINNSGMIANFGQRPFAYTPPTGFVALNTFNLPTPTIGATETTQANKYFDATAYSGTGSSQTVVNSGSMQPDFVWIKQRNSTEWNSLADSIRGTDKQLFSNSTNAEQTNSTFLTAFASNGFTVDTSSATNASGSTYIGWQWKGGGTGVTNTDGSITSTVSANTSAGFSVITYDGIASAGTVGHGLGVAPKMIIVKRRSSVDPWVVWHTSLANTEYLYLNSTAAKATNTTYWNSTFPTSSVFSLGLTNDVNATSSTYVAYVFSEVAGYSKFGSYTGNGSTDGTFVYTGFKPKFLLIKNINDGGAFWAMFDGVRNPSNNVGLTLFPNASNAEGSNTGYDFLSNGFKVRDNATFLNTSGQTMIYMAIAETPAKFSLAR